LDSERTSPQSEPSSVEPCCDDFAHVPLIAELRQRHEAGHFCAAVHYGFRVRGASVLAGDGHVEWTSPTGTVSDLIAHMTVFAAGGAAQRKFGAVDATYDEACLFDNDRIDAIAAETETAIGRELPDLIPSVKDAAEKFVAAKWSDIEFIAHALGTLGTVDEREAGELAASLRPAEARQRPYENAVYYRPAYFRLPNRRSINGIERLYWAITDLCVRSSTKSPGCERVP
jgi:hypothetical protein